MMFVNEMKISELGIIRNDKLMETVLNKINDVEFYYFKSCVHAKEIKFLKKKEECKYPHSLKYMQFAECDLSEITDDTAIPNIQDDVIVPIITFDDVKYIVDSSLLDMMTNLDKDIIKKAINNITKVCMYGEVNKSYIDNYNAMAEMIDDEDNFQLRETSKYRTLDIFTSNGDIDDDHSIEEGYDIYSNKQPNSEFDANVISFTQKVLILNYIDDDSKCLRFSKNANQKDVPSYGSAVPLKYLKVDQFIKSLKVLKVYGTTELYLDVYYKPFCTKFKEVNDVATINSSSKIIRQMATLGDQYNALLDVEVEKGIENIVPNYEPRDNIAGDMDRVLVLNKLNNSDYKDEMFYLNNVVIVGHYEDVKSYMINHRNGYFVNRENKFKDDSKAIIYLTQHVIDDIVMVMFSRLDIAGSIHIQTLPAFDNINIRQNFKKKSTIITNHVAIYSNTVVHLNYAMWNDDHVPYYSHLNDNEKKMKHPKMREILNNI